MESKTCPICKVEKPVAEFSTYFSAARQKTRIANYCRPCHKENSRMRAKIYYEKNKEARKQYAVEFRANPENKPKIKNLRAKFKKKYREELQDCYVAEYTAKKKGMTVKDVRNIPGLINVVRTSIFIKRKIRNHGKK